MLTLPPQAFLPRRHLEEKEIRAFIDRRNRLFAAVTPAEQQRLLSLAQWYSSQRHRLLATPNIFSVASVTALYARYHPLMPSTPNARVRALAWVSTQISRVDRWLGDRLVRGLFAELEALRHRGEDEVLMGVASYLRALPLELGFDTQRALEDRLEAVVLKCASDHGGQPQRRMESIVRAIRVVPEARNTTNLRRQAWALLLAVAQTDIVACIELIDNYWNAKPDPAILCSHALHEAPELAYGMAVALQAYRPLFAAEMMSFSLLYSSFMYDKIDAPDRDAMEQIMDASCRLLATWVDLLPHDAHTQALRAIDSLLTYGNPTDAYWSTLPGKALGIIKGLEPAEQLKQIRMIARIPFYSVSGSAQEKEGLDFFDVCFIRGVSDWGTPNASVVPWLYDVSGALSILEDKVLAFRNRRIAANPTHPLLNLLATRLQDALMLVTSRQPERALQNVVAVALALSNRTLVLRLHDVLRKQFEARARAFPVDAGAALQSLIKYRAYSQSDDEMYRSRICQESFDLLIPVLDGISSADATIARAGTGWDPRQGFF